MASMKRKQYEAAFKARVALEAVQRGGRRSPR
jgi:hypothetical protein